MKFLALLVAMLLEQVRPLRQDNTAYRWFSRYAASLERHFNTGHYWYGMIAWVMAAGPAVLIAAAVYLLLYGLSPLLAWLWNIVVLYLTLGFRQYSQYFTEIYQALSGGNLDVARDWLGKWRGETAAEFSETETARVTIEQGMLASHRYLFGALAWFVVLGPAGAMLYRASALLEEQWGGRAAPESNVFGRFAERVFFWLDWLPVRLTAASFAVVGNFEDAVYCWRTQAPAWSKHEQAVILASGGGALGVRLGSGLNQSGGLLLSPELGVGDEADMDYMQSMVGLIWRALVLWMFLLLVVTVAYALG
jgi:adenosylcobinamide-phosphate synthase